MSTELKISVVIPTLDRPEDLLVAVKSILDQKCPPFELIIVDQSIGSDSYNIIQELYSSLAPIPKLIYIHDNSIKGLVEAKNFGVSKSNGDIVSFLEDDEELNSKYLENVLKVFKENDTILGCSGIVSNIRRSLLYRVAFRIFHRGMFDDKRLDAVKYIDCDGDGNFIFSTHISGGLSSYRKKVFDKIKFDLKNNLFYCEDIDFSIRASDHFGLESFVIATNVCLRHYMSPINRDVLEPRWFRKTREFILLYKKNKHRRFATVSIYWLIFGLFFESIYSSINLRNHGPIFGFFNGLLAGIKYKIQLSSNIDLETVESFGEEWKYFDQSDLGIAEKDVIFNDYFGIFPWDLLPENATGFDLGCGSGRWASLVADKVKFLNCIDPSKKALEVAKKNLNSVVNVDFYLASVESIPLPDNSQDFGYSLGVLHHIPDTASALKSCVKKLKPGAPFLLYLYYAFDNRSIWYRSLWFTTNLLRRFITILPESIKRLSTDIIAIFIYFTLARFARLMDFLGANVGSIPLSYYRDKSFYTMRTDARDRFGTSLEQRFTQNQISIMMQDAGLTQIKFSDGAPYWCATGIKI
jgi:glycosyltransferase involved in cell wall biosynthesis/ubiquinone/menaquinone biosynthesis C-methylase UbiE